MRNIYILLSTMLLAAGLFSCSKESPFSGTDNHLLALNLTVGEQEYKGVVTSDNKIHITVPLELDLNNAKVAYIISEQASILPMPEKVNDWNNDQVFNVISYNGDKRTYTVHILRQKETAQNDVVLATDADVKAFAEKGISRVNGNLIIGRETGGDSITGIDALTYLTKVDYNVVVNPTYKGQDLSGLRNVTEMGGLKVDGNKFLKKLTLKSLETVYEDMVVKSDLLTEINLPKLVEVRGRFDVQANGITSVELPELLKTKEFRVQGNKLSELNVKRLESIAGDFILDNLPSLSQVNLSKLQLVSGNFTFKSLGSLGTCSLPSLVTVGGNFSLQNCGNIAEFYLPMLAQTKSFNFSNNKKLTRVMVPEMKEVDGDFNLSGIPIKSLDQVSVKSVSGKVKLSDLTSLQSVKGFIENLSKAQSIELNYILAQEVLDLSHIPLEDISISNCSNLAGITLPNEVNSFALQGTYSYKLEQIPVINGLHKVKDFSITNMVKKEVSSYTLEDLETVENNLTVRIANADQIKFPALKQVGGTFSIPCVTNMYFDDHQGDVSVGSVVCPLLETAHSLSIDSPDLQSVDFPKLTTLDGLKIVSNYPVNNNSKLINLSGFKAIKSVREVETSNLKVFSDYSFLRTVVENGSLEKFSARGNYYNPTLSDLKAGKFIQP